MGGYCLTYFDGGYEAAADGCRDVLGTGWKKTVDYGESRRDPRGEGG